MNHIELFAGCGGLSLGLKSVNSKLLLANELSPMAGETFAFNFFPNEDLCEIAEELPTSTKPLKTKWLSSQFELSDLSARLRENPQEYPELGRGICDLRIDGIGLEGSLVIGSIVDLNKWLNDKRNKHALERLKLGFGDGEVDLVSGGPPCQSFSMAGMREYTNSRNVLPWEFAKFVELVQPKFSLLENVSGILRPFEVDGKKVYAWFEVAVAFAQIRNDKTKPITEDSGGYIPLCLHINAKSAGVAQNRPRFIMLSFRRDIYLELKSAFSSADRKLLESSEAFFNHVREGRTVMASELKVHDAVRNPKIFAGTFLEHLIGCRAPSVKAAIDDLRGGGRTKSTYVKRLDELLGAVLPKRATANNDNRSHSLDVQRRFRIYQVLEKVSQEAASSALKIINRKAVTLENAAWQELRYHTFYVREGKAFRHFKWKTELERFLIAHQTGKHSQRALVRNEPAPAALSIPDDACHYFEDIENLRTLTVREMARIQSFPDNFTFRSKVTTGGVSRKFEVPQYTQVGNAVPPLLGRALGRTILRLLELHTRSRRFHEDENKQLKQVA